MFGSKAAVRHTRRCQQCRAVATSVPSTFVSNCPGHALPLPHQPSLVVDPRANCSGITRAGDGRSSSHLMPFDGGSRWCLLRRIVIQGSGARLISRISGLLPGGSTSTRLNKCRTNKMRWASTALTLRLGVQYAITDAEKKSGQIPNKGILSCLNWPNGPVIGH